MPRAFGVHPELELGVPRAFGFHPELELGVPRAFGFHPELDLGVPRASCVMPGFFVSLCLVLGGGAAYLSDDLLKGAL